MITTKQTDEDFQRFLLTLAEIHRGECRHFSHGVLEKIEMKLTELDQALANLTAALAKAKDEVIARVAALEDALLNSEIPADATAKLEALKESIADLDAKFPDLPVEEPPPEEPPVP